MNIEMRWYKSVDDANYVLQYRTFDEMNHDWGPWIGVPYVLEARDD